MNIVNKRASIAIFKDLKVGDCFEIANNYYIKIQEVHSRNAVRLSTGEVMIISCDEEVKQLYDVDLVVRR